MIANHVTTTLPSKPCATGLSRLAWRWLAAIAFGAGCASLLVASLFLLLPVEPWRPLADRLLGLLFGWWVPSIAAMGLGICMAPLLCLALLVVLAMRCEPVEHEVGSQALERDRSRALRGKPLVERGDGRRRRDEQRKCIAERVLGRDAAAAAGVRQALLLGVEAHQAQAPAEEVAEPLRGQRAHVVGAHRVVPHPRLGRRFHRVEPQVQRQHAGRAQHEVALAQRRPDQHHARQIAL